MAEEKVLAWLNSGGLELLWFILSLPTVVVGVSYNSGMTVLQYSFDNPHSPRCD